MDGAGRGGRVLPRCEVPLATEEGMMVIGNGVIGVLVLVILILGIIYLVRRV
jgi:hypothetical protein